MARRDREAAMARRGREAAIARRRAWIGMAMAIPATVAFTPFHPPETPPGEPHVITPAQPVAAATSVAPAPAVVVATPAPAVVAATPVVTAQPVVAAKPVAPAQPVVAATPVAAVPAAQSLPPSAAAAAPPDRDVGSIVVDAALTRLGAPYAWGAAGPDSFDCSGLVVWAFHQAGITLPHSSQALASGGQPVALDQMEPGDVISLFPDASHVGIYVGDGRMIHASFDDVPVAVESLFRAPINNVRRYR